jgi:hypothetical protein
VDQWTFLHCYNQNCVHTLKRCDVPCVGSVKHEWELQVKGSRCCKRGSVCICAKCCGAAKHGLFLLCFVTGMFLDIDIWSKCCEMCCLCTELEQNDSRIWKCKWSHVHRTFANTLKQSAGFLYMNCLGEGRSVRYKWMFQTSLLGLIFHLIVKTYKVYQGNKVRQIVFISCLQMSVHRGLCPSWTCG